MGSVGLMVYLVDDDPSTLEVLRSFYTKNGYDVESFSSPLQLLEVLQGANSSDPKCDLIISDQEMPQMNGITLMEKISQLETRPPVILLTGHANDNLAIEALGKGAFDYISKPINFTELSVISDRAIKVFRLQQNYLALKKELSKTRDLDDIVGKSPQMERVFDLIKRVSVSSCNNILITGESGTGKELVARAIHSRSSRAKNSFYAINCAAIPETLLESELFGHAKGSFTGATGRRIGLLEEANGGTLLLDEIGDMPLSLQGKLLRVLQEKKLKPIGDNAYRNFDVRIIAATHRNLPERIKEGQFRQDLYYRLCIVQIHIPPLRDRIDDIPLLAQKFLKKYTEESNSRVMGFTKAAMAKLMRIPWSGNVRELENTIERALIFCDENLLDEKHIQAQETPVSGSPSKIPELFSRLMTLRELEKEYIEYTLSQLGNKKEKVAEILGVNRKTLYRKQREYGISPNSQRFKDNIF